MVVVYGWKVIGGVNSIQIINPLPECGGQAAFLFYSDYAGITGNSHWRTLYNIKKPSSGSPSCAGSTGSGPTGASLRRKWKRYLRSKQPLSISAATDPHLSQEASSVAKASLNSLFDDLSEEDAESLGVAPVAKNQAFTLEAPLRSFLVNLEGLKVYQPGDSADDLLGATPTLTFPVRVDNEVRIAVVVNVVGSKVEMGSIGQSAYIKRVAAMLADFAPPGGSGQPFLIDVQGVNVSFLAMETKSGGVKVASLFNHPALGLTQGTLMSLSDAFMLLRTAAQELNGLPT